MFKWLELHYLGWGYGFKSSFVRLKKIQCVDAKLLILLLTIQHTTIYYNINHVLNEYIFFILFVTFLLSAPLCELFIEDAYFLVYIKCIV